MYVSYTLKDNSKINGFYWSDFAPDEKTFHYMEVYPENRYEEKSVLLVHDPKEGDKGKYFFYKNKEKIYVEDYDYLCLPMLIEAIQWGIDHKDIWFVKEEDILHTFLKFPDKFAVKIEMPVYNAVIPFMGIGITGNKRKETFYIPKLTRYPSSEWHYKIEFTPFNEDERKYIANETYYFSDFASMVRKGYIKIVELPEV